VVGNGHGSEVSRAAAAPGRFGVLVALAARPQFGDLMAARLVRET